MKKLMRIRDCIFLFSVTFLMTSCGSWYPVVTGQPTPETEMDRWSPPSEQELAYRQERQAQIDAMEADIQARYLFQESLKEEETALLNSLRVTKARIVELEPEIQKQINDLRKTFLQIQAQLTSLKASRKELAQEVAKYKDSLIPKKLTADNYVKAIRLFQLGEYKKSVSAFEAMLRENPPRFLEDNIHFGLANAYYKMKKWESSEKHFNTVVEEYPFGNKWPASYLMLSLIHNNRNEKSKALFILDKALKKYLPDKTRQMIETLRKSIQGGAGNASS